MKVVAIIQARMGSKRFPGKVMADLCGKPVLQHVIEGVQMAKGIDEVVVAWPYEDIPYVIDMPCRQLVFPNIATEDVLGRFVRCAEGEEADWIIRVCGDNPLIDPRGIRQLAICAEWGFDADYICHEINGYWSIDKPTGYFAELIRVPGLKELNRQLSPEDAAREHVTKGFHERQSTFRCLSLARPDWYTPDTPNASIDTPEDLERVRAMMEKEVACG